VHGICADVYAQAAKKDFTASFKATTSWGGTWAPGVLRSTSMMSETIYSTRWTSVVFDEVHLSRSKRTTAHQALCVLSRFTTSVLGLSATPIVTDPLDLAHIGRLLNVPGFTTDGDAQEFVEMDRRLKRAKRADGKPMDLAVRVIDRMRKPDGEKPAETDALSWLKAAVTAGQQLRRRFEDTCLRRVPRSRAGELTPEEEDKYPPRPIECMIALDPTFGEKANLDKLYDDMKDTTVRTGESVSTFTIGVRVAPAARAGHSRATLRAR
jgi:hypothetical protein